MYAVWNERQHVSFVIVLSHDHLTRCCNVIDTGSNSALVVQQFWERGQCLWLAGGQGSGQVTQLLCRDTCSTLVERKGFPTLLFVWGSQTVDYPIFSECNLSLASARFGDVRLWRAPMSYACCYILQEHFRPQNTSLHLENSFAVIMVGRE